MHQARIFAAELSELARIRGGAQDQRLGRFERTQNLGEFAVAQRSHDDEVVRQRFVISPEIAAQHRDAWRVFFRLPAGGQQPCKISFIGQDQYVCASQKWPAPRKFVSATCDPPRSDYNFSASSKAESKRLVLMPKFTAASVSLACLATSTRSCNRETSTRATERARSSAVALPVSFAASVAAVTMARATTARRKSSAAGPSSFTNALTSQEDIRIRARPI